MNVRFRDFNKKPAQLTCAVGFIYGRRTCAADFFVLTIDTVQTAACEKYISRTVYSAYTRLFPHMGHNFCNGGLGTGAAKTAARQQISGRSAASRTVSAYECHSSVNSVCFFFAVGILHFIVPVSHFACSSNSNFFLPIL